MKNKLNKNCSLNMKKIVDKMPQGSHIRECADAKHICGNSWGEVRSREQTLLSIGKKIANNLFFLIHAIICKEVDLKSRIVGNYTEMHT